MISSFDVMAVPIIMGQSGLVDGDIFLDLVKDVLEYDVLIRNVLPPQFLSIHMSTRAIYQRFRAFWIIKYGEQPADAKLVRDSIYSLLRKCFKRECFGMFVHTPDKDTNYERVGILPVNGDTLYSVGIDVWNEEILELKMPYRKVLLHLLRYRLLHAGVPFK